MSGYDRQAALVRMLMSPENLYERNKQWVRPDAKSFETTLMPGEEQQFRQWVFDKDIPFRPDEQGPADYDMRGFWKGLQSGDERATSAINPNDGLPHFPDVWKTPYHETFSAHSQWATPDAPKWTPDDRLVTDAGQVLFDERGDGIRNAMVEMLMKGVK